MAGTNVRIWPLADNIAARTCPLSRVKQTWRLHPKLTHTVATKEYPALLLVRVGNDDHLILSDIERHEISTNGERPRILLARLTLDVGDCWRGVRFWRKADMSLCVAHVSF
jgi:hypothetical protein